MSDSQMYSEYAGYRCLRGMKKSTSDLYLTYCGMEQCAPRHSWGPDSRPDYHIHFVLDGAGYLEIGKNTYAIRKGQIFLLPPNITVHYYADPYHPYYYSWAAFNGTLASYYLKQAGFTTDTFVRDCNIPAEKFADIVHQMLIANQSTLEDELKRLGCLFHLFALLIKSNGQHQTVNPKKYASAQIYVKHAIQYIEYNYNNDIQINDIADYLELNRSYFTTIFKQEMNLSPKTFLSLFRIEKAKDLLSDTSLSVSDISERVGYKNPFTFSKIFKKFTGYSPSEFRIISVT